MSKALRPKNIFLALILIIFILAGSLRPVQTASAAATVSINGATTYQVIDGFGASDAFHTGAYARGYGSSLTAEQSAKIMELLFSPTTGTATRTFTPSGPTVTLTRTPTQIVGASITPTPTRSITPTLAEWGCSPISATITAPFTFDGAGTFCWQSSNLGTYINSWNSTSVSINGVNITNLFMASGSYPTKVAGYWYISYQSTVAWAHFETK